MTCCASPGWRGTIVLVFLATAGFALPREPGVKLDRARAGSARQSTAGRNELDTGKPRRCPQARKSLPDIGCRGKGSSPRSRPGRPGPNIAAVQPSARRFTNSVATGKAKLRLGLPPITADILRRYGQTEVALRDELPLNLSPRPAAFAAADWPHARAQVLPCVRRSILSAANEYVRDKSADALKYGPADRPARTVTGSAKQPTTRKARDNRA